MKQSLEYNHDDEAGYADDDLQQDNETATEGARFVKQKFKRTADHVTVQANPLDADLLPRPDEQAEDDDEAEPELPRAVAPKTAKQQVKDKLAAAMVDFKLP